MKKRMKLIHIKQILYLDAPDIIVEVDSNPIFTIEESKEAATVVAAFVCVMGAK